MAVDWGSYKELDTFYNNLEHQIDNYFMQEDSYELSKEAKEHETYLKQTNPILLQSLSEIGIQSYSPKGILQQAQKINEYVASKNLDDSFVNASIGVIGDEKGQLMYYDTMMQQVGGLKPMEVVPYGPSAGIKAFRSELKKEMEESGVDMKYCSDPVATSGGSHAIYLSLLMFLNFNKGEDLLTTLNHWDNYDGMCDMFGIKMKQLAADEGGLVDLNKLENDLLEKADGDLAAEMGKKVFMINVPNNPTGESMDDSEIIKYVEILKKYAAKGNPVVVICDDAYEKFDQTDNKLDLFTELSKAHNNIIAVKNISLSKSGLDYGLRLGGISIGNKLFALYPKLKSIFEQKLEGLVRTTISLPSILSQNLYLKTVQHTGFEAEADSKRSIYLAKHQIVKEILPQYLNNKNYKVKEIHGGLFAAFELSSNVDGEKVWDRLIKKYNCGTIFLKERNMIRIAWAYVATDKLQKLFEIIDLAITEVASENK